MGHPADAFDLTLVVAPRVPWRGLYAFQEVFGSLPDCKSRN